MDRPSPGLLAALCLLLVGAGLVAVAAADVTDSSGPRTYSVDETDGELRRYADLSGPARDVVDAGADGDAVVVDELPSAFRSGRWNFVRDGGGLVCLLPTDDAESGTVTVAFADCGEFAFEFGELSDRGQALFTAAKEDPDGYVWFAGTSPAGLGTASINGVPVAEAPEREGRYYVFANGRVYEFQIRGPGPLGGFPSLIGDVLLFALGSTICLFALGLVAGEAYGSRGSAVRTPAAVAVGASVYLVRPLVEAVGLIRASIWLDGYHWAMSSVLALVVGGVAYVLPDLYELARRKA